MLLSAQKPVVLLLLLLLLVVVVVVRDLLMLHKWTVLFVRHWLTGYWPPLCIVRWRWQLQKLALQKPLCMLC